METDILSWTSTKSLVGVVPSTSTEIGFMLEPMISGGEDPTGTTETFGTSED
jgi:hypothetical protein